MWCTCLQGGFAFITIKGVLKLYYKQQQYIRQAQRRILNYENEATSASTQTPPAADWLTADLII